MIMETLNVQIESKSENESLARVIVSAFAARLDPTLEEISDIKTAVSEAVTNCVIHGYEEKDGIIFIECTIEENNLTISIKDEGVGIEDIEKARLPMYSTKRDKERSGMGFSFMEIFMDKLTVESELNKGTVVTMIKKIGNIS